jgi:hypothetical protein
MKIETGKYYVLQSTEEGHEHEKYIMLVLPKTYSLPEHIYRTETLAIHNMKMWENDWIESYFHREASPAEIEFFVSERAKFGVDLQGVGEMVTGGFKIEKIEDLPKLIDYVSR